MQQLPQGMQGKVDEQVSGASSVPRGAENHGGVGIQ